MDKAPENMNTQPESKAIIHLDMDAFYPSVEVLDNPILIGHEKTVSADILEIDSANQEILSLANKVARRMRRDGFTGRTITLKVKYSDFVQITRSTTLPKSIDDGLEICSTACRLLEKTQVGTKPIRLLGVSISQLSVVGSGEQLSLFEQGRGSQRRKQLNTALDSLSERFGEDSIRPATLLSK